jgi:carboxyl-terminal processing protease
MGFQKFFNEFDVTDSMLKSLVSVGETNGVKPRPEEINKNKPVFKLHVKAQIARQVWDNDGFYPLYNQDNDILQQAIKLFDQADNLDRSKL